MGGLQGDDEEMDIERVPQILQADSEGEAEAGSRKTVRMQNPKMPHEDEVAEHYKTHLPYRSWCRHCVRGKCRRLPHRAGKEKSDHNELHFDFCFLGKEGQANKTMPVIAVKERDSGMLMGAALPTKTTGSYVSQRVMAFMKEVGVEYGDLTVKSDQEPAIQKVIEDVGKLRAIAGGGKYVVENSPVGSSASNGVIERGIQAISGQARVLLDALESRCGVEIEYGHPILCYIIEYAAFLINRFEVGHDGRTPYERCKGKKAKTMGIEFGEAVLWKRKAVGGALGKLSSTWDDGIYLGVRGRSGEMIVADGKGVWKTRSIQRKPVGERWRKESVDMVRHAPWRKFDDDPEADGELPAVIRVLPEEFQSGSETMDQKVPRRMYIKKEDLRTHGYTAKCKGCMAVLKNATAQAHSEECRKRLEKAMDDTEKGNRAKRKVDDYLTEALEKEDKKRKAAEEKKEMEEDEADRLGSTNQGTHAGSCGDDARREKRKFADAPSEDDRARRKVVARGEKRSREDNDDEDDQPCEKKVFVGEFEVNQEAEDDWHESWYVDDRTGKELTNELVDAAEKEEMKFMEEIGVGTEATDAEAWEMTGKAPISTKFVRVNKGTDTEQDVRARLVARDFRVKGDADRFDLFAAMPPLEAKKMLFRQAARSRRTWRRGKWRRMKVLFVDVKKAHLNAKVPDDTFSYVKLPCGKVWRLRRWLYGMRPAAQGWESDYTARLEEEGFVKGRSAPTTFFNKNTGCRVVVHGDDFTALGYDIDLKELANKMKQWYDLKVRAMLGDEQGDDHEVTILNRKVTWKDGAIEYQADAKHAKAIMEGMGVDVNSNGLEMPIDKEKVLEGQEEEEVRGEIMNVLDAKKFRGLAATANYLALDRADIQFTAKEICRRMSQPRQGDWQLLKRLARYLAEHPTMVWRFSPDEAEIPPAGEYLDVFSDSDWAGDVLSRKSTSGGVATIAGGTVKTWSSTQGSIATSSGEAEYYALIKAAAEGLGIQALAEDLGWKLKLRIFVDSSAAKSIAARIGLGRVRHMEVKYLWAQEAQKKGRFLVRKMPGDQNSADVLTKPMSITDMSDKLREVGGYVGKRMSTHKFDSRGGKQSWADMTEMSSDLSED